MGRKNEVGKWAMHFGRDKKFSKRMGREYKGEERARKTSPTILRGFGARQEETWVIAVGVGIML